MEFKSTISEIFSTLGLGPDLPGVFDGERWCGGGKPLEVRSPVDGALLSTVRTATADETSSLIGAAAKAFESWRAVPAPKRGEIVRDLGTALRAKKDALGKLVTLEMGKCLREGLGEVQEMIDICDYACGQSRMLYGLTTHSERRRHRMFEQWHPLGAVAVITAFNFPVAVWSWNTAIALICGDTCIWKPSSSTPLTAIACTKILDEVLMQHKMPRAVNTLVIGSGAAVGDQLVADPRIPLVSYTGSTPIGKKLAATVGNRLGRTILELGGNNAVIVTKNANIELAARSILFGAIGTAGQRCTSTRRVVVHRSVKDELLSLLRGYYGKATIGNPLELKNLMGPLVNQKAARTYFEAIGTVKSQGGNILWGGEALDISGGCYVTPCVAEVAPSLPMVQEETFAPLLYVLQWEGEVQNAIAINNGVPQGLSSSIFTENLREAEAFLAAMGSDCGIANVNTGTSGAEIGLAFGGEKETGGGRESGSDAWKAYMRRQTNTVNWSGELELAQGIEF